MSSCTFYIVRHAHSLANEAGIRAGQMDFDLAEKGYEQAQNRAKELSAVHFDAVFSSDLIRARKTAEIIALEHKLEVQTTKILRERAWGEKLEGGTVEETKKLLEEYDKLTKEQKWSVKVFPDMESDEELIGRFTIFLRETAVAYPGKTVLIVCHGNLMRTFLVHLGLGTPQEFHRKAIDPTGYVVVKTDGSDFEVVKTVGIQKNQG